MQRFLSCSQGGQFSLAFVEFTPEFLKFSFLIANTVSKIVQRCGIHGSPLLGP
jgi:hypothetical protein